MGVEGVGGSIMMCVEVLVVPWERWMEVFVTRGVLLVSMGYDPLVVVGDNHGHAILGLLGYSTILCGMIDVFAMETQ